MKLKRKNENGNMLVVALIISMIAAIVISSYMQSSLTSFSLVSRIRRKVASETIAEGGVAQARALLIQSAVSGNSLLSDIHTGGSSGYELESLGGDFDKYRRIVLAFEESGNPSTIELGPLNFRIFSSVEHIDTGVRFTVQSSISLVKETYAKIAFGMIHPSGAGPFNFIPSIYSGEVHFGNFGGVKPTFLAGAHIFSDLVTFESTDSTPYNVTGTTNINFQKGFDTGSDFTSSFDPTAVMASVCANATGTFSDWVAPGQDLCLYFKDDVVERHVCVGEPRSQDALTAYGALLDTKTIPNDGAIICSNENIGVKGIYSKGITVASQKNLIFWGDIVTRHQDAATYTGGFIAKSNIVIPADIPIRNMDYAALDYMCGMTGTCSNLFDQYSGYTFPGRVPDDAGETNFPVNHQFVGYPASPIFRDMNYHNGDYTGTVLPINTQALGYCDPDPANGMFPLGCTKRPGTLDIDGAVMAADGKLDVSNINDPATPDGRMIPGYDNVIYRASFTAGAIPPFYVDSDHDNQITFGPPGSPDNRAAGGWNIPKYCFYGGNVWTCPIGGEMPRPRTEAIWINGGLIVKDFSSIMKNGCAYNGYYSGCGFNKKVINYNPLLRKYPPPGFPKPSNKFNTFINWTKKYVDQQGPSSFHL